MAILGPLREHTAHLASGNFVNRLISKTGIDALYVVGPGHGAPAILSSLWLENSLSNFYPKYSRDKKGLGALVASFSSPGGFPR